ncbi:hypothetical protein NQ317_010254 [Molorchus minor]|uniref:Cytochrome P450 n=1 Tax=Molorchus minor TaxID=1323400 RepID=A0ABQ9IUP1_9CUCU|nr:hypothetical protein NQ317_010254 [Molorchus minor]
MVSATFSPYPMLKYIAPDMSGYNLYVKTHLRLWGIPASGTKLPIKRPTTRTLPRDFMDIYINAIESNMSDTFTEDQLVGISGSETTNNTLGFVFLGLITNPDVQRRAQGEIDAVVGKDRTPTLHDRPNMPYVECVALEALRMFGGRALTLPHRALKDTYLGGYLIPKDTLIVGNFYDCMLSTSSVFENSQGI